MLGSLTGLQFRDLKHYNKVLGLYHTYWRVLGQACWQFLKLLHVSPEDPGDVTYKSFRWSPPNQLLTTSSPAYPRPPRALAIPGQLPNRAQSATVAFQAEASLSGPLDLLRPQDTGQPNM